MYSCVLLKALILLFNLQLYAFHLALYNVDLHSDVIDQQMNDFLVYIQTFNI